MASRIADILVRAKVIDELQLRSALAHQAQWGGRLPHIVVEKRFAAEAKVVQVIADALKLPTVDLDTLERDAGALAKLDVEYARTNAVFPCALKDGGKTLWLAMADPTDVPVTDEVEFKTRARLRIVVASERQIQAAIKRFYLGETAAPSMQTYGTFVQVELTNGPAGEDDGKVVDASGNTLVRNIRDIRPTSAPGPSARAKAPPPPVSEALDDLLGGGEAVMRWSARDLERLHAIQDQQEKGARILRAVLDLCVAKGYFTPDDYRQKLKKA